MPLFMDTHGHIEGLTADAVAQAHEADLKTQEKYGVKYLRYIADQLQDEGAMERIDRGLFTFASYNAGPARIGQLRRKAKARGLDPKRWFGNVEMVAAREIGQETVQYVANIYKYYVSYTLIQREAAARRSARGG